MADVRSTVTISDLRRLARRRLPEFAFFPMDTGCGDGSGSGRNVAGFSNYHFTARVLVNVQQVKLSKTVFGREYASPFGISATGYANNLRRHAEQMLAEAAAEANIPFMLSGGSTAAVEEVTRIAPDHVWQQIYSARDPGITDNLIGRAADAGVRVLVYTVDVPVPSRGEWTARKGITLPSRVRPRAWPYVIYQAARHPRWSLPHLLNGGFERMDSWSPYAAQGASNAEVVQRFQSQAPCIHDWRELERIRRVWPGSLVVKGVLHGEDVDRAIDCGADAVTISNHGGFKLDALPAAIESLREARRVARGNAPLFFDGGIRKGGDILVALALGAHYAFVGRATLYGVIAGGTVGALRAIQILNEEAARALALVGCSDVDTVGPALLHSGVDARPARMEESVLP